MFLTICITHPYSKHVDIEKYDMWRKLIFLPSPRRNAEYAGLFLCLGTDILPRSSFDLVAGRFFLLFIRRAFTQREPRNRGKLTEH